MGTAIGEAAERQGATVVLRVDETNRATLTAADLRNADIAIEFTRPDAAVDNLLLCLEAGIPVVCGTTGWHDRFEEVATAFKARNGALVYASNFSIGVNLLFEMNRIMAGWMAQFPDYKAGLTEIHHTHKLDKPSGTAVTLASGILSQHKGYSHWHIAEASAPNNPASLPIDALREDEVVGIHEVNWTSPIDSLQLRHEAFSRAGFVQGVLVAANWVQGRQGVFSMKDVLFPPSAPTKL